VLEFWKTAPLLKIDHCNRRARKPIFEYSNTLFAFIIGQTIAYRTPSIREELRLRAMAASERHASLQWPGVQATLLDICLALYPLALPPYVLLEIVDRFAYWQTHVAHHRKIAFLIGFEQSCRRIRQATT
jgi:hypothetical protein